MQTAINDEYLWKVSDETEMNGIYKGLVNSLGDKYSEYMTPAEVKTWKEEVTGTFTGIGVTFSEDKKGNFVIMSVLDDSPAKSAGLKAGDIITKVNGKSYESSEAVKSAMRGNAGTTVKVTILRNGKSKVYRMVRAEVDATSVYSAVLKGNIGYIRITAFEEDTANQFKKELTAMENKNVKGMFHRNYSKLQEEMMRKYLSELVGTLLVVFAGCGSAVAAGALFSALGITLPAAFTTLAIAMQPIYKVIALIGIILVVVWGGKMTIDGIWTIGRFSAYITIFASFAGKCSKAAKLFNSVQKAQISWLRAKDSEPYGSFGNGSAMRVSPVGFYADCIEEAMELAKASAEVTHNHPEGIKGAQATAAAIFLAKDGWDKEQIKSFIESRFYKLDFSIDELSPVYRFDETCTM